MAQRLEDATPSGTSDGGDAPSLITRQTANARSLSLQVYYSTVLSKALSAYKALVAANKVFLFVLLLANNVVLHCNFYFLTNKHWLKGSKISL